MSSERVSPVHWLFLALSLSCQLLAVILGKVAALRMGAPSVTAFLTNPWYVGGLACLLLQAVFWQVVLRHIQLFIAYLATSLSYLLILAASRLFFHERVSAFNVAGGVIIVAGVYLLVREDLR
jgi:drug/metabolite transporter (DMT)-like permease